MNALPSRKFSDGRYLPLYNDLGSAVASTFREFDEKDKTPLSPFLPQSPKLLHFQAGLYLPFARGRLARGSRRKHFVYVNEVYTGQVIYICRS